MSPKLRAQRERSAEPPLKTQVKKETAPLPARVGPPQAESEKSDDASSKKPVISAAPSRLPSEGRQSCQSSCAVAAVMSAANPSAAAVPSNTNEAEIQQLEQFVEDKKKEVFGLDLELKHFANLIAIDEKRSRTQEIRTRLPSIVQQNAKMREEVQ